MKDSIKNIIKSISIVIIILVISIIISTVAFIIYRNKNEKGIGISSRTIDINILNDKILCKDELVFNINTSNKINYSFIQNNEYLSNVGIYINNNSDVYSTALNIGLREGYINIDEHLLNALKDTGNKLTIKLTYELNKNYIKRYTNTDILPYYIDFKNIDYLNNLTINLDSNDTISNLNLKNANINQNNGKYVINMKGIKESTNINMSFNIDTKLNNVINSKYIDEKELREKEQYNYIDERLNVLVIFVIMSVIIFIISFIINKKIKVRNYRRETSDLVSPILAEGIIDRKIGMKELIMTTIIELNIKGNIKIINNDTIELVSLDNLELYEKSIVELLFKDTRIRFSDINNIFAKSNKETIEYSKKINQIKNSLKEKIFSMEIFSKKLTIVNKVIVLLAMLININLPQICVKNISETSMFFGLLSLIIIIDYVKKEKNKTTMQEEIINNKKSRTNRNNDMALLIMSTLFIVLFIVVIIINVAKYKIFFVIIMLLILALNIYTAYRSQATALTRKGRIEQNKLAELKKYIDDYSLIKNRDLESVIIWDKYLAYATAFGIPNKVTNSIYEEWYNLNLNLQVVEKLLS